MSGREPAASTISGNIDDAPTPTPMNPTNAIHAMPVGPGQRHEPEPDGGERRPPAADPASPQRSTQRSFVSRPTVIAPVYRTNATAAIPAARPRTSTR